MRTENTLAAAIVFATLICSFNHAHGTHDTITHFINIQKISAGDYPKIEIQGFLRSDQLNGEKKKILGDSLKIINGNDRSEILAFETLYNNHRTAIHLFLDINFLERKNNHRLFGTIFFNDLKDNPPYPQKYIYIPNKSSISPTSCLPKTKRIKRVKHPPGALHIKKMSKTDSLQKKPRLQVESVKEYITDSILNKKCPQKNHLFIFAFHNYQSSHSELIEFIDSSDTNQQLWSFLYYEDQRKLHSHWHCKDIRSFLGTANMDDVEQNLEAHTKFLVKAIENNQVQINFHDSSIPDTIQDQLEFHLAGKIKEKYYRQPILVQLSDQQAHQSFTRRVISRADSMQQENNYPQALDYLFNKYQTQPKVLFRKKSKEVFLTWSKALEIQSCSSMDSLIHRAEHRWQHSTDSSWYKNMKYNLLKKCYHALRQENNRLEKKRTVLSQLLEIRTDPEFQKEYWLINGQMAFQKDQYWKSLYQIIRIQNRDSKTNILFKQALDRAMLESYGAKQYRDIYEKGADFIGYINQSFRLKYIYGRSCAALHHYRKAANHYQWLLENWDNSASDLISLDQLYEQLQVLNKYALNFAKASELNKLIYKRSQKKEHLYSYLSNLRGRYLEPLISLLPGFINKIQPKRFRYLFENYPITYQPFIRGLYLYNTQEDAYQIFYHKENGQPPVQNLSTDNIEHFPAYAKGISPNDFFLINRVSQDSYIFLHLDRSLTHKEKALFSAIQREPNQLDQWENLHNHQQTACLKTLSQFIAGMFETEIHYGHSNHIRAYWSALTEMDVLVYMVLHGKGGKIKNNKGFTRDDASYKKHQYQKSATTMAFYQQTIHYKDQQVYDISNPIFNDNQWYATLRIGFKKE